MNGLYALKPWYADRLSGVPALDRLSASATARGSRTLTVGLGFAAFGLLMRRHRRRYGHCPVLLGGGFTAGLSMIVAGRG
ncbi:hypothetical protein ACFV8E_08540 [Streptomyces sp. NPDC059849]|uniref:hypothetical protein n=1 Tax=Streptomyces sp. NPDC059849 TaxID=3346969 RepID=UPI00365A8399